MADSNKSFKRKAFEFLLGASVLAGLSAPFWPIYDHELTDYCENHTAGERLAYSFATEEAAKLLSAPDTAEWPSQREADISRNGSCTWVARGEFRAQNALGVPLRGHFDVGITLASDGRSYRVTHARVD